MFKIELVEDLCYLGSNISRQGNCDKESEMRIGKASSVFGRLADIWKSNSIRLRNHMDIQSEKGREQKDD